MKSLVHSRPLWLLSAFTVFFALRIWNLQFGLPFDGIHPTEYFSVSQAQYYLGTHTLKPLDLQHPTLYQYLITLTAFLSKIKDPLVFYLIARLISCLASLLSVFALYLISRRLFNSSGLGLLCASFLGLNPLAIQYAHYAVPDSLAMLFVLLAAYYALRVFQDGRIKDYILCGIMCGLSIGSKFTGLISVPFLLSAHFLRKDNLRLPHLMLGVSAAVIIFCLVSPYHLVAMREAAGTFRVYLSDKGYISWGNLSASGLAIYPLILLPAAFGRLSLLLAALGSVLWLRQDRRSALIFILPVLAYFLVIAKELGATIQNLLAVVVLLGIFAAAPFFYLRGKKFPSLICIIIAVLALSASLIRALVFDYYLMLPDTRVYAQEWLLKNVKPGGRVIFERYTPFDLNYTRTPLVSQKFEARFVTPTLAVAPAETYKSEGYDYLVTSSFKEDNYRFFAEHGLKGDEVVNYDTFAQEFNLVQEFDAPRIAALAGLPFPWGTWPHNPTVKIYKVRSQ